MSKAGRASLTDSAVFWLALGSAVVAVGGSLLGVWFGIGLGVVLIGSLALLWAMVLHLAGRHSEVHGTHPDISERPHAPEWRPPVDPSGLAAYLDEINRTMEAHGFGRNPGLPAVAEPKEPTPSWEELNDLRVRRYEESRGLFLVHSWRASSKPGQVADVVIRLHQHGDGPLAHGLIRVVEYTLGPKFNDHSLVCTRSEDAFEIEISLWGPMLCLAKVYFVDKSPPVVLERYINFDTEIQADARASG
ncbi:MAG: pYEATS domain-containing protein [Gaiellaceae bacterium]